MSTVQFISTCAFCIFLTLELLYLLSHLMQYTWLQVWVQQRPHIPHGVLLPATEDVPDLFRRGLRLPLRCPHLWQLQGFFQESCRRWASKASDTFQGRSIPSLRWSRYCLSFFLNDFNKNPVLAQGNRSTCVQAKTTARLINCDERTARRADWGSVSRQEWHWEVSVATLGAGCDVWILAYASYKL